MTGPPLCRVCFHPEVEHGDRAIAACAGFQHPSTRYSLAFMHAAGPRCGCPGWSPEKIAAIRY